VDVAQVKERMRHVWGLDDYSVLARLLVPVAVELCDRCAVSAGQEVLDVAAGDGNFALACAREGAAVVASDIAPGMVERGRARTREEGYEVEWLEADAEELPFEAGRFDCVGSVFGAMLAPRPDVVSGELFRVVKPGGTVGMTAWTHGSFSAEMFEIGRRYISPPPDMPLSHEWGDEAVVRERFGPYASAVDCERRFLSFEADSAEAFEETLDRSAPTQVAARQTLPPERFEAMKEELRELVGRWNRADGGLRIDSEYLLSVARKRG
jgi:ubiquinone/menaquinone biosynthesis C-methylase UbiE